MTAKERVLTRERERGKQAALDVANKLIAGEINATQLIEAEDSIPDWNELSVYGTDLIGCPVKDNGQVYTILQAHTPANNPGYRPADLPAIYSIKHTQNPKHAKAFVAPNGTSGAYMQNDCTVDNGRVYRSNYNGYNVWRPTDYAAFWDDLGTVKEVQG